MTGPGVYTPTTITATASHREIASSQWTVASAWPHHPALLPPMPREARSSALDGSALVSPLRAEPRAPARPPRETRETRATRATRATRTPSRAGVYRTPVAADVYVASEPAYGPARERARHATRHVMGLADSGDARPVRPATRQQTHARAAQARSGVATFPANLDWPSSFDDWMIDIMRRRALRLNSGARRRGAPGSVRAVELAHIMEQSRDANGHWICAICKLPVTLDDLSFDHIVALADGGEHAAHNLAPAHRKCNEIKGSEKAQYRAQSLDRWLTEWSSGGRAPGSAPLMAASQTAQPRYA